MKLRFALPLASTLLVVGLADVASANTVYDARTLGMGGNSIGYSGNASLAYWNPAAVARGNQWGVYLPSVGASANANLGVQDMTGLVGGAFGGNMGAFADTLGKLGGNLNVQGQAMVELTGFSLGKVGPGSMAVRLYNNGLLNARANVSSDLATDLNGLFFQNGANGMNGLATIQAQMEKVSANASNPTPSGQAQFKEDVGLLRQQLGTYMKSFIKLENGRYNGNGTVKRLDLNTVIGANAALAATYAQPVPVSIPQFPEAELSVGATAKVLGSLAGAMANVPVVGRVPVPGSNGGTLSPLGGSASANVSFDMDKEVSELVQALDDFGQNQDLASGANVAAKAGAFANTGLGRSQIAFSSTTPNNVGLGMDLGAAMKLNKQWSVGAALVDPVLLWGAQRTTHTYSFTDNGINVNSVPENVSFREGAPMIARLGAAYSPSFVGVSPLLTDGLMVLGGVEAPFFNNMPASFSLGAEKLIGPLAVRLGTQQGGLAPLYTAGLGLQTPVFQLQLGAGVNNPADLRSAALALSMGAGF